MSTLQPIEQIKMLVTEDNKNNFPDIFPVLLPTQLKDIYGGNLCFLFDPTPSDIPLIHVNFVMSEEGIFNLRNNPGGGPISQGNMADPFIMALLRAHTDAVMVGANTLNSESEHVWNFQFIFENFPQMQKLKELKRCFEEFRASLGKEHNHPPTFFMTNSGRVNPKARVFREKDIATYIVTGARGADVAREILADAQNTQVLSFGEETLDEFAMLAYLKQKLGIKFLLHEGGRGVVNSLTKKGFVSEFFLTHMNTPPAGEVKRDMAQYLFETGDRMLPQSARIIEKRIDAVEKATFLNLDFRFVRLM